MQPLVRPNTQPTEQAWKHALHRRQDSAIVQLVRAGTTLLCVLAVGAMSLPLMLLYLALILVWLGLAAISLTYLVGAAMIVLVWLYEGDLIYLWRAGEHLAVASAWFSLVVAGSYVHGAVINRLRQRRRDASFDG